MQCGKAASDPVSLVHRITIDPGRGAKRETTYDYHNGRIAPKRNWSYNRDTGAIGFNGPVKSWRFLGFERIEQKNENTGEIKKTFYSQTIPFQNSPIRIETYSGEGELMARESMAWKFHSNHAKGTVHDWNSMPWKKLLASSTMESFEQGTPISTVATNYEYDALGFEQAKTTCSKNELNIEWEHCATLRTSYRNHDEPIYEKTTDRWIFGQIEKRVLLDSTKSINSTANENSVGNHSIADNQLSGKRWDWQGTGSKSDQVEAAFQLYCRDATGCSGSKTQWIPTEQNLRYNQQGQPVASTNAKGVTTELEYDPDLSLLAKTVLHADGKAFTTKKEYYKTGTSIGLLKSESNGYNQFANPGESEIGKRLLLWDRHRRLQKEINPLGGESLYQYGPNGKLFSSDTVAGNSQYKMVTINEPLRQPDGSVLLKSNRAVEYFDGEGKVFRTETTGENEKAVEETVVTTHQEQFEEKQRVRTSTWPHLSGSTTPKAVTSRYDSAGRKRAVIRPNTTRDDGFRVTIDYGFEDVIEKGVTKRLGTISTVTPLSEQPTVEYYDARGLLVQKKDALGNLTRYEYDSSGRAVKVTLPMEGIEKSETLITWDSLGRKTSMKEYATGLTGYEYDKLGNLTVVTDSRSRTELSYDKMSRVVGKWVTLLCDPARKERENNPKCGDFTAGPVIDSVLTYHYDEGKPENFGRLTAVDVGETRMSYNYDRMGNMVSRQWFVKGMDAIGSEFSFEEKAKYNPFGRMTDYSFPDGKTKQDLIWTGKGELHQVGVNESGADATERKVFATFSDYTPTGRFQKKRYLNGVVTRYDYHDMGMLRSMKTCREGENCADSSGTGTIQDLEYIFHAHPGYISEIRDNRTDKVLQDINLTGEPLLRQGANGKASPKLANTSESQQFVYDSLGRLTSTVWDHGRRTDRYGYDSIGNMTRKESFQNSKINELTDRWFSTTKNRWVDPNRLPSDQELSKAGENVTWDQTVSYDVPLNCESSFSLGCQSFHQSGGQEGIRKQQQQLHELWNQKQGSLYDCDSATSDAQYQSCRVHRESAFVAWLRQVDHTATCDRQELFSANPVLPDVIIPEPGPGPYPYPNPGEIPMPGSGGDPAPWVLGAPNYELSEGPQFNTRTVPTIEGFTTERTTEYPQYEPPEVPQFTARVVDPGYCEQAMSGIHQTWLAQQDALHQDRQQCLQDSNCQRYESKQTKSLLFRYDGQKAIAADSKLSENSSGEAFNAEYDTLGNMIQKRVLKDGKTTIWQYAYDGENRLVNVTELIDGTTTGKRTSFTYDQEGQRIKKIYQTTDGTVVTTWYFGDTFEIRKVVPGKANEAEKWTETKYVHSPGHGKIASITGEFSLPHSETLALYGFFASTRNHFAPLPPDVRLSVAGTTANGLPVGIHFYHQNHINSSSVITNLNGKVVTRYVYEAFGELIQDRSWGINTVTHKFTSQELDEETDLMYYGARYYDPSIGRFLTADTIVPDPTDAQTFNRYAYVINNPISYEDPTGHFAITTGMLIWGGGVVTIAAVTMWTDKVINDFKQKQHPEQITLTTPIPEQQKPDLLTTPATSPQNNSPEGTQAEPSTSIDNVESFPAATQNADDLVVTSNNQDDNANQDGINSGINLPLDGEGRARKYSSEWGNESLSEAINKFAPGVDGIENERGNKILYTNKETKVQIVYDKKGDYFRIEDTKLGMKNRRYLDMSGEIPNNKTINGKQQGRSKGEYQQVTHFNNTDNKKK